MVYEQVYEPVAGSLALSALVAAIPIILLFALLAGIRVVAQWTSLAVALVIAALVYGMPVGLAINSTLLAFGLFPMVWILLDLINMGELPAKKFGPQRTRVRELDLERWTQEQPSVLW